MRSSITTARLSRRNALRAGAAAAIAAGMTLPRAARAQDELNILVWCDHTDTTLLQPF